MIIPDVVMGVVKSGDGQSTTRHLRLNLSSSWVIIIMSHHHHVITLYLSQGDLSHGGQPGVDVKHGDTVNILDWLSASTNLQ